MRGFKAFAFAATASVLLAGSLQAQTGTGRLQWFGFDASKSSNYLDKGNVFTSPYQAKFFVNGATSPSLPPASTNNSTYGPTVDIFCVDYLHYASSNYAVNFTNLGTNASDVGKSTRWGTRNTLANYLAAAYLANKISAVKADQVQVGRLNGAIWQIMSGAPLAVWNPSAVPNVDGWDYQGITNLVTEATTNQTALDWQAANASNWVVVTDVASAGEANAGKGFQEHLTQVTPEPATMLLLGTGLVVMLMAAGALRRPVA